MSTPPTDKQYREVAEAAFGLGDRSDDTIRRMISLAVEQHTEDQKQLRLANATIAGMRLEVQKLRADLEDCRAARVFDAQTRRW